MAQRLLENVLNFRHREAAVLVEAARFSANDVAAHAQSRTRVLACPRFGRFDKLTADARAALRFGHHESFDLAEDIALQQCNALDVNPADNRS